MGSNAHRGSPLAGPGKRFPRAPGWTANESSDEAGGRWSRSDFPRTVQTVLRSGNPDDWWFSCEQKIYAKRAQLLQVSEVLRAAGHGFLELRMREKERAFGRGEGAEKILCCGLGVHRRQEMRLAYSWSHN